MSCRVVFCPVLYCHVLESLQTQISSLKCSVVRYVVFSCLIPFYRELRNLHHPMTMFQSGSLVADSGDGSEIKNNIFVFCIVLY